MKPRRYQLRKDTIAIIERGHPWVFRDQLSTAASVFHDGDWLRLVDGTNRIIGYGTYEASGAIAIRVHRIGEAPPDAAWVRTQLETALARRAPLVGRTDGIRLVHGENDGIPAVAVDRFGDTLVISSYSAGSDAIARYLGRILSAGGVTGPALRIILRPAKRRASEGEPLRMLYGTPAAVVHFVEDGLRFAVDLAAGQKTGAYLDLRGLRRSIATAPLAGARVLNLFAYSGMLGRAAEAAGAASITHVDSSERALAFAAVHHGGSARHEYVTADVFDWLPAYAGDPFDLIVVDPPAMTSSMAQVPSALAAYRRIYRAAARHVRPGGAIVAACCTSRIARAEFHRVVAESLPGFTRERELPVEVDHPVRFKEADYLKIAWWRAATTNGLGPGRTGVAAGG